MVGYFLGGGILFGIFGSNSRNWSKKFDVNFVLIEWFTAKLKAGYLKLSVSSMEFRGPDI